jgi:hypothetical protein
MNPFHFSGVSSRAKIASTGQAGTHAPQSMHSSGWMNSISADSKSDSSFLGWIQSTGQTSTHAVSLVPTHGSQMIYATEVSRNNSLQPESIVRRLGTPTAAALCLVSVCLISACLIPARAVAAGAGASLRAHPPAQGPADWRDAPEYVALFTPATVAGFYRAYVSPLPMDAVLRILGGDVGEAFGRPDTSLLRPAGAWEARPFGVLDAFGRSGAYDRLKLARLYAGRTVEVARGPRAASGRVVESWSLVSPYPDRSLERIESGTLIIVLTLGAPEGPPLPALP